MNAKKLDKMDSCRIMLGEPASSVVGELISELRLAQSHLECAWGVIANCGHNQGGWEKQDAEWLKSAEKWRDSWLMFISDFNGP